MISVMFAEHTIVFIFKLFNKEIDIFIRGEYRFHKSDV